MITRFPLHRERALVKFALVTATGNDEDTRKRETLQTLRQYFSFSRGVGVVVFGTKARTGRTAGGHTCTPVKPMGGDYDGDLYFVCGYRPIVDGFRPRPPREDNDEGLDLDLDRCCLYTDESRAEGEAATASLPSVSASVTALATSLTGLDLGLETRSTAPCLSLPLPLVVPSFLCDDLHTPHSQYSGEEEESADEAGDVEPPLVEAAIHPFGIEGRFPSLDTAQLPRVSLVTAQAPAQAQAQALPSTLSSPRPVVNSLATTNECMSPLTCHFLKCMLTPPAELAALSPSHLVEAVIWEWLAEVHAQGRHTQSKDEDVSCDAKEEKEKVEVNEAAGEIILCDHTTSSLIKHKMFFFENNSKLISR